MLKSGKKILLLLLALALTLGVLAGCNPYKADPLDGYTSSDSAAESNGGFVVKKDEWFYFINGAESYTADNTFGDVVKGSLARVHADDLASGNYSESDIVVPQLIVSEDHTSGIYVYGDYVYYATPNTSRNMDGEVVNSVLNFRRTKLDGTDTSKNYVQLSDNTSAYRYVQVDGTVYLLYADSANSELHSLNTATGEDLVIVSGYSAYAFDQADPESPYVYYTMSVVKKNTYEYHAEEAHAHSETESYNQLWRVRADATEAAYTFDMTDGYIDTDIAEGKEGREMEYTNFGTLVLDGIGREKKEGTPFNIDWAQDRDQIESARGYTYSIVKYMNGIAVLSVTNRDASTAFVYALEDTDLSDGWSSIAANPGASDSGALTPIAISSANATASALYYKQNDTLYYLYLGSDSAITRAEVSDSAADVDYVRETTYLARAQSGATLLYLDGGYLYYSMAGTSGNSLWRIRYDGAKSDYVSFGNESETPEEYKPTQYLQIDYNDSWFAPEVVGGYLFFSNVEDYAQSYVYAFDNSVTNTELKEMNDLYEEVLGMFTDVSAKFADASKAIQYYFYTGSIDLLGEEKHKSEYEEEDFDVIDGFVACAADIHGYDFTVLKDAAGTPANVQSYFYGRIGKMSEEDAETLADTLVDDLILTDPDAEE